MIASLDGFVAVLVGGGTHAFPSHLRLQLELVDECRFGSGAVHVHCRTKPGV